MILIATSDWHLSSTRPLCRVDDDWIITQSEHLHQILLDVCGIHTDDVQVVVAGDVFDTPTVAPVITNMVVRLVNNIKSMELIGGNHDFMWHRAEKVDEGSFGAIRTIRAKKDNMFDFGTLQASDVSYPFVALHTFAVPTEADKPPLRESKTAQDLCNMFPNTPIIIVGDNHAHWDMRIGKQLVVNCGTLIQRTAAEAKRQCGYYRIDTDTLSATYVDLSYLSDGCIDLSYMDDIKERKKNAEAYESMIAELKDGSDNRYDFITTLKEYTEANHAVMGEGVYNILMTTLNYINK